MVEDLTPLNRTSTFGQLLIHQGCPIKSTTGTGFRRILAELRPYQRPNPLGRVTQAITLAIQADSTAFKRAIILGTQISHTDSSADIGHVRKNLFPLALGLIELSHRLLSQDSLHDPNVDVFDDLRTDASSGIHR